MKYFVFDLGGVLSVPMVSKKLYGQIKWKVSYDEFLDKFNNSAESIKVHKGEISTKDFFEYLKGYMDDDITLEEFKNIYVNNNKFFTDTIEIIKKLKNLGYKVYLLSNLKEIDYEKFIKHFDVSIFDEMFLSFKLDMLKPNDDIYQYVINKLNTKPENIYFFDDNKENVDGAIRNGINAYQVTGETVKKVVEEILNTLNNIIK